MLFSATLSVKARNIAWEHMNSPVEIEIEPQHMTVDRVAQSLYHVAGEDKMRLILGIMRDRRPRNAIVFTNTKRAAEEVAKRLEINGYPSEFIMGDLPQRKRQSIIRKIKAGETQFLVATDVAARGLHIDDLDMVINYDLPEDPEAYVHRIGRTARAGESGQAISLACQRFVFGLEAIEQLIKAKIPVEPLSDASYAEDKSAGIRIYTGDARERHDRGRANHRRDARGHSGGAKGATARRSSGKAATGGGEVRSPERRAPRRDGAAPKDGGRAKAARTRTSTPRPERGGAKRHEATRPERRAVETVGPAPRASDDIERRLAYYRKKYGEDFQPTDAAPAKRSSNAKRSTPKRSGKPASAASTPRPDGRDAATRKPGAAKAPTPTAQRDSRGSAEADTAPATKKGVLGRLRDLFRGK